jgi:DNA-nicking Smr family endonuclease
MPKKRGVTEEERALFQAAVKHVTPLSSSNHTIQPHQLPRASRQIHQDDLHLLTREPLTYPASVGPEETLQFIRSGLQTRLIQRLKRGEFEIDAVLDLHGFNLITAEEVLQRFLTHAIEQQWRCVQIIHGKGSRSSQAPLLKNSVNQWLRAYAEVLAFCSASANDGGAGAVYALLKNTQKHRI